MSEYVVVPPPDKSISHRAVIFSSLAKGKTFISNFLFAQDCLSTCSVFKSMGVPIFLYPVDNKVVVHGVGKFGLKKPFSILNAGNSGTTIRIVSGILSAQSFDSIIDGDDSLRRRPMKRIVEPLKKMGAFIEDTNGRPPLKIYGRRLKGTTIISELPSAQVKSCILLAGLLADGITLYKEVLPSRDHTERMFDMFSVPLEKREGFLLVDGSWDLSSPRDIYIPSDISSAAFWIAYALLRAQCKGEDIVIRIKEVGINPTRLGFVNVLKKMGVQIFFENVKEYAEPYADIVVKSSDLKAAVVEPEEIPKLIDEVPILAVIAAFADGVTVIKGVAELRVKESDRVNAIITNLRQFGVNSYVLESEGREDLVIEGRSAMDFLKPAQVFSYADHRIAMAFGVMLHCLGENIDLVDDLDCVKISYPDFWEQIRKLERVK